MRALEQMQQKIGTEDDDYEMRQSLLKQLSDTTELSKKLAARIGEYQDISVAFNQQKVQRDKHAAFQ